MKSQAEGWFIILDPAAPVSKSQKYYINLTSSNYLIISTERGGKELRNVDVSKYDSLAKEQVGNEMHIKLSKHFNENIPNIQMVTSIVKQYEEMYSSLKNSIIPSRKSRNKQLPEPVDKIMRKLKSRLDLNIGHLYEIRRLSHSVERGLMDNISTKQSVGKDLTAAETTAIETLEQAKARYAQGIQIIETNDTQTLKGQLKEIEKTIEKSWTATHNFVLNIGKQEINEIIKDWELIAHNSEDENKKKLQQINDIIKEYKGNIHTVQKRGKYLLIDYKKSKAKNKQMVELHDTFKDLTLTLEKAIISRKEKKQLLEEIEKKNERIVQLNTKNNLKEEVKEIDTDLQNEYNEILTNVNNEVRLLNEELLLLQQQEAADFAVELSDRDIDIANGVADIKKFDDEDNEKEFRKWYLKSFKEEYNIEKRRVQAMESDDDEFSSGSDDDDNDDSSSSPSS